MESASIIVLGGPSAGKTVYLTVLYRHLWQGFGGMTMRAGTGTMHSELLAAADDIEKGIFPPATQALRHFDFELEHARKTYQIRFLDYPGELFRKVFYDAAVDSDEAQQLYDACLGADGVIALVDPQSILDGTWDIDYAMTNLMRFYSSNGRKNPKLVLAFTKRDETQDMVNHSVIGFVQNNLPHLSRMLGDGMRLIHFCSINKSGDRIALAHPQAVSAPIGAVIEAIESEEHAKGRKRFVRRLRWKRTVTLCVSILLFVLFIVSGFFGGVYCRNEAENRPSPDRLQTVAP